MIVRNATQMKPVFFTLSFLGSKLNSKKEKIEEKKAVVSGVLER